MARFDDQFERYNPLTWRPAGPGEPMVRRIAWESQAVLDGIELSTVVRIANVMDTVASHLAQKYIKPFKAEGLPDDDAIQSPEERVRQAHLARQVLGDSNLLDDYAMALVRATLGPSSDGIHDSAFYAVLALWKLIDYMDAIRGRPGSDARPTFRWASAKAVHGKLHVDKGPLVADTLSQAAYASAMAWQLAQERLRAAGRDELAAQKADSRRAVMSEQNKKNVLEGRWESQEWVTYRARAVQLAQELGPFKSFAKAATKVIETIDLDHPEGGDHTHTSIVKYLKEAGWKPDPAAVKPNKGQKDRKK